MRNQPQTMAPSDHSNSIGECLDEAEEATGLAKSNTDILPCTPISGLCSRCWNMTTDKEELLHLLSGRATSVRSCVEVETAALAGCAICRAARYRVPRREGRKFGQRTYRSVYFVAITRRGKLDRLRICPKMEMESASAVKCFFERLLSWKPIVRFTFLDIYTPSGEF